MVRTETATQARRVVAAVEDPELPFVTIEELGILRDVEVDEASPDGPPLARPASARATARISCA